MSEYKLSKRVTLSRFNLIKTKPNTVRREQILQLSKQTSISLEGPVGAIRLWKLRCLSVNFC